MGIRADQYFWFDGVEDVDQANWGRFWRGFIPDGVIVGFGQNLMVSANSSGMHVQVATGEAMVYGVRVFVQTPKVLPIEPAEAQNRIDLIVCRAVFLNDGQSYAEIAAKKGIAGSAPVAPSIEQSAANIWEIPLAAVTVPANAPTISSVNVADRRVFFSFPIEQGGTGAIDKAGARANLGITYGTRQVTVNRIAGGNTAPAYCQGLPDGGMVWIEPVDECWEVCSYSGVRYYSHSANILKVKATTSVISPITLNVGWIKVV